MNGYGFHSSKRIRAVSPEQLQVRCAACGHDIIDRPRQVVGNILGQHRDLDIIAADDRAAVRGDIARKQFHEGGLARTVPAQQADPFVRLDLERSAIQEPRPAEADRNLIDPYQSHTIPPVNDLFRSGGAA